MVEIRATACLGAHPEVLQSCGPALPTHLTEGHSSAAPASTKPAHVAGRQFPIVGRSCHPRVNTHHRRRPPPLSHLNRNENAPSHRRVVDYDPNTLCKSIALASHFPSTTPPTHTLHNFHGKATSGVVKAREIVGSIQNGPICAYHTHSQMKVAWRSEARARTAFW